MRDPLLRARESRGVRADDMSRLRNPATQAPASDKIPAEVRHQAAAIAGRVGKARAVMSGGRSRFSLASTPTLVTGVARRGTHDGVPPDRRSVR